MFVNGASDRKHQIFFCYREASSDDYQFRIEDVYQSGDSPAERAAYLFNGLYGQYIFFCKGVQNIVKCYFLAIGEFS